MMNCCWLILRESLSSRLCSSNWLICQINSYNFIWFKYSLRRCCTPSIKHWNFLGHILSRFSSTKRHLFWLHASTYRMLYLLYRLLYYLYRLLNYLYWFLKNDWFLSLNCLFNYLNRLNIRCRFNCWSSRLLLRILMQMWLLHIFM